jgi:hypothetical protein
MKNQCVLKLLCVGIILSGAAFSQGIYFKAGGSYNLGLPSSIISDNYTSTITSASTTQKYEYIYGTYGKGVGFDGAIGYKGENLGIEVGVSYLLKSSIETTSKYTDTSYVSNYANTYESTMLAISPCFVFVTNVGFYGRAGAILGFPKLTYKRHGTYSSSTTTTADMTEEYNGDMALGFTGAVGFAVGSGEIKLYIEADVVSLTWAPTSIEITAYKVNGQDQLSTLTASQKKANYEETLVIATPSNPNVASVAAKNYLPYSSVGLKAGIMIGF